MAINIKVYPQYSPRIIEVLAPTTTASLQELINAVRAWEDTAVGMGYPYLIDASGKEDLGGGVKVGITAELQNAKILFQQRNTVASFGTVDTADTTGEVLIDSTATFITDGVAQGDTVWNTTDGSRGTVLSIDSETQLTMFALEGGTENDWDISDAYKIWQEIEGEINGGNLVAVDDVGAQIDAFFASAGTSVTRTSSSSATLQEQADIRFGSYDGGVTIDTDNNSGRALDSNVFPAGTLRQPALTLDNLDDITIETGIYTTYIIGNLTLDNSHSWVGHIFIGESSSKTTLTIPANADVLNCEYQNCFVTGTLDGDSVVSDGTISSLNFVQGEINNCFIGPGTITLGTSTQANITECYSAIAGTNTPTIDMGGTGILALRNYYGGITLTNYSGSDSHSIDLSSGQCILDNTVTSGTFVVRGVGKLKDTSGNTIESGTWNTGVTIVNETTGTIDKRVEELWKLQGLDSANPLTLSQTKRIAGDIDLDVAGDNTLRTVTRN